jgi:hypothetical protein
MRKIGALIVILGVKSVLGHAMPSIRIDLFLTSKIQTELFFTCKGGMTSPDLETQVLK